MEGGGGGTFELDMGKRICIYQLFQLKISADYFPDLR